MGLIVGIPASVAMTEMMIRGNEPERIYDRCFRLRHNWNQVNETEISLTYSTKKGPKTVTKSHNILGIMR